MKNLNLKIFAFAFLAFLSVRYVSAQDQLNNLQSVYTLTNAFSQVVPGTETALVTVWGYVFSEDTMSPDNVQIRFKYRLASGGPTMQDTFFTSDPDGEFTTTVGVTNPLACGEEYNFYLYEFPEYLIEYQSVGESVSHQAFSLTIDCNTQPSVGDVMAPNTAQPMWIAGVNWGDRTVTDRSITFQSAHLIPVPPHGFKTFKLEYGRGVPGQSTDYGQGFIAYANPVTVNNLMSPPYKFSGTISGLMPATDYYFNIWEIGQDNNGNQIDGNLYVYGFNRTAKIPPGSVNYTFTAGNTGVRVYGHLDMSNGVAMQNAPIKVLITTPTQSGQPQFPEIASTSLVTGGINIAYGNGFFEANMGPVTPGNQYLILVQYQSTGNDIIEPILITVPTADTGGSQGQQGQNQTPPQPQYNGLVACGGAEDCDFYALIATVNRVIDFLIKYVAFPLVAIVVAWAGIKLLISGGSSEAKGSAKKMIGKVIVGLIIALLSWIIIKLILVTLGYVQSGPLWGLFGMTP